MKQLVSLQKTPKCVFRTLPRIYERALLRKQLTAKIVNYFCKKLHHRCLTESCVHLYLYIWRLLARKFYKTRIFSYFLCKDRILDIVFIREDTGQRKAVFGHLFPENKRTNFAIKLFNLQEKIKCSLQSLRANLYFLFSIFSLISFQLFNNQISVNFTGKLISFNSIQDGRRGKKVPYQFFLCNFSK